MDVHTYVRVGPTYVGYDGRPETMLIRIGSDREGRGRGRLRLPFLPESDVWGGREGGWGVWRSGGLDEAGPPDPLGCPIGVRVRAASCELAGLRPIASCIRCGGRVRVRVHVRTCTYVSACVRMHACMYLVNYVAAILLPIVD